MARTKSTTSIEAEIIKINGDLAKLQKKQEALSDRLLELQKQKQEYEFKQVMDAFRKSGKSLQELMTFLDV
jgi:predicted  nucleic acid-binding Zn-ribbon protein